MLVSIHKLSRGVRFGALILALAAAGACEDDPTQIGEEEPEVVAIRLVLGSDTVTLNENGTQSPATFTLPVGTTSVSAQFLRADGQPDPIVTAAEYQLNINPIAGSGVTFTRSNPFTGTLSTTSTGQKTAGVSLFHIEELHDDFGPRTLNFTVGQ
jgi:hypothetical protein